MDDTPPSKEAPVGSSAEGEAAGARTDLPASRPNKFMIVVLIGVAIAFFAFLLAQ